MNLRLALVSGSFIVALAAKLTAQEAATHQPVDGLIQRLVPSKAASFTCETIPAADGRDVFEIAFRDSRIILRGNSPLSQAVAFNRHLKHHLHGLVSLNGSQVRPPAALPDPGRKELRTEADKDRLEWNARRVVSLWGNGTRLRDYAWKEWSGLLSGYYARRWEIFFRHQREALEGGEPFDPKACDAEILSFEMARASGRERFPAEPAGDTVQIAARLLERYFPE